jgi:sigma-E factor negative regulatory protein RseC
LTVQSETQQSITRGVVRELDGETALVEVSQTGCGRCNEPGGCGGLHPGKILCSSKPRFFRASNPLGAQPGEAVEIAVTEGAIGAAATHAYVWPLVLLLLGGGLAELALGHLLGEWAAVLGALGGLAAGWIALGRGRHSGKPTLPRIVERNVLSTKEYE